MQLTVSEQSDIFWRLYKHTNMTNGPSVSVYNHLAITSIGLSALINNDPRDTSIGKTLVYVWVY